MHQQTFPGDSAPVLRSLALNPANTSRLRARSANPVVWFVGAILFMLATFPALAVDDSTASPAMPAGESVPGGFAVIPIHSTDGKRPVATYNGRRAMVLPFGQDYAAVVGIPLKAAIGTHTIAVRGADKRRYDFNVIDKKYAEQRLTITDKRKVNPNPDDQNRIAREMKRIGAAKSHWSDSDPES